MGGFGLKQTNRGSIIAGFWHSGIIDTPAIYIFEGGDTYMGQMKRKSWRRDGFGKYHYKNDGSIYVGMWKKDKRHGLGIWFNNDGSIREKGVFEDDALIKNM